MHLNESQEFRIVSSAILREVIGPETPREWLSPHIRRTRRNMDLGSLGAATLLGMPSSVATEERHLRLRHDRVSVKGVGKVCR